jgi:LRR receptor-like serine/threonine-protein kinase FLS2
MRLIAGKNYLTEIPPVGQATRLEILKLSDNKIYGSIPSELALLPEISMIDLARNFLSGTIPTELTRNCPPFLKHIYFDGNLLNGTCYCYSVR